MLLKSGISPLRKVQDANTIQELLPLLRNIDRQPLLVETPDGLLLGLITSDSLISMMGTGEFSTELRARDVVDEDYEIIDEDAVLDVNLEINNRWVITTNSSGVYSGCISREKIFYEILTLARKKVEQLDKILDWVHNGIIAIDINGIVTFMNKAAEEIIRRNRAESIGKHLSDVIIPLGLLEILKTGEKQLANKFSIHYSQGTRVYMTHRTPILVNNQIVGAVGVFQDISEIEGIADELNVVKQLNKELETIFEASYDGMMVTDAKGKVLRENRGLKNLLNVPDINSEKLKRTISEKIIPRVVKSNQTSFDVIESEARQLMVTANPVYNNLSAIERVVLNIRDLTELNSLKKALQESKQLSDRYHSEMSQMSTEFDNRGIIIRSELMKKAVTLALRVANVDSTVLIQGESGTGKEIIASIIHQSSKRKTGPFIKVNCGAIPESLLESELFGYESGAFTGANKTGKAGIFELANDGTLFLDEIGELPVHLQVKLLRVLQEKEFMRIGGQKTIKFNGRIITASNRDLESMVTEGTFREDLFFRLNVIPIVVPPLRERKEDIIPLLKHFQNEFSKRHEIKKDIAPQTISYLLDYNWPGNVRELINIMERIMVTAPGSVIMPEDLPKQIVEGGRQTGLISIKGILPLKSAVQEVEKQLIRNAIEKYGSTYKAAQVLKVDQSTVVRKMNRLKSIK